MLPEEFENTSAVIEPTDMAIARTLESRSC